MAKTTPERKAFDFKFKLEFVEGEEPAYANHTLAQALLMEISTDESKIIKYLDLARDLKDSGVVQLDNADRIDLKNFIISNKKLFNLAKGQLLKILN